MRQTEHKKTPARLSTSWEANGDNRAGKGGTSPGQSEGFDVVTIHHDTRGVNHVEQQKTRTIQLAAAHPGSRRVLHVPKVSGGCRQTQCTSGLLGGLLAVPAAEAGQGARNRRNA